MTDQEINEACARKLGWKLVEWRVFGISPRIIWMRGEQERPSAPPYCRSIEAAWEIAKHCTDGLLLKYFEVTWSRTSGSWYCVIGSGDNPNEICEGADTAPMAMCLAFLKLP